jgi:chromosome segregation ATPase
MRPHKLIGNSTSIFFSFGYSRQHNSDEQRTKVDTLCSQLVTTKSKMQRLSKDIMIVEAQLPDLEDQKTMAVGGRDFKTAAKTSSKIKHLRGALEQSIVQKEELQQAISRADAELKEARQTLNDMVQDRKEAERTMGMLEGSWRSVIILVYREM